MTTVQIETRPRLTRVSVGLLLLLCATAPTGCRCRDQPPETPKTPVPADAKNGRSDARQKRGTPPAERFAFPVIDSHTHIRPTWRSVKPALAIFRRVGVVKFVNKSGGRYGTPRYKAHVRLQQLMGWHRFAFFITLNWKGVNDPGWGEREAKNLALAVKDGAVGVKIFKALGLAVKDTSGKLIAVDDPRLFPIWRTAGKIGAIVAMHTGDPKAFFEKPGPQNERWDELKIAKSWSFYGPKFPSRKTLLAQRDNLLRRFPQTIFLGIHFGNNPEDIDYVARTLANFPNFYIDVAARLGEIGRHAPEKVRALFLRFPKRILFGTDLIISGRYMQLGSVSAKQPTVDDAVRFYLDHRRYFETSLKQIRHPTPIQGRWRINAIALPRGLLRRFYFTNAWDLIFRPQIARRRQIGDYKTYRRGKIR